MIYIYILFSFLKIVLVWPLIVFLIFLFIRKPLVKLIDDITELGWGEGKIKRKNKQNAVEEVDQETSSLKKEDGKWNWKVLFLDLFIKPNSLHALKWFFNNPGKHTNVQFAKGYSLFELTGRDENEEKDAILNALRETELVHVSNSQYEISQEGIEYLRSKNLI
jgi:hypothetical protein